MEQMKLSLLIFFIFVSCTDSPLNPNSLNSSYSFSSQPGSGRILKDNPIILSSVPDLNPNTDLNSIVGNYQEFVTYNPTLLTGCGHPTNASYFKPNCFQVLKDKATNAIYSNNGFWSFDANSAEFLQVNDFTHTRKEVERFEGILATMFDLSISGSTNKTTPFPASMPKLFYQKQAMWYDNTLTSYALCPEQGLAYFLPTNFSICLGVDSRYPTFALSQDPTVIYHEMGHVFVKIAMNARNLVSNTSALLRSDLGQVFYDEGGAINEGIADYFSFVMTQRTHFAEWALGRFYKASRPITELDPLHIPGISNLDYERLSYPQYILYNPNDRTSLDEDIHLTGMIASHFLVALTQELELACIMDHTQATQITLHTLFETLMFLGDLTAKGTDFQTLPPGKTDLFDTVNLTTTNNNGDLVSKAWLELNNPINFRRFFQTYASKLRMLLNGPTALYSCAQGYTSDQIETLLDKYGLLLFDTYNDNGGSETFGHSTALTPINLNNRNLSHTTSKNYLLPNPPNDQTTAFIFDRRAEIFRLVNNLQQSGRATNLSPLIPSTLGYNNGNGRVSLGEVVGIALNLYNNSNEVMGGVQVLANDWDHGKIDSGVLKPCNTFEDNFPSLENGGIGAITSGTPKVGDCEYITRTNGGDTSGSLVEELMPVCFIQYASSDTTLWVSQDNFQQLMGLPAANCLGGATSTKDCYIKALDGGEQAFYTQINPNATWGATLFGSNSTTGSSSNVKFNSNNIVLMQISPYLPPGTTVNCRFRVRFTNCSDCFEDQTLTDPTQTTKYLDDYLDYEYAGGTPYKIVNFQFTVID